MSDDLTFKGRKEFSSYLLDCVITHEMNFFTRVRAAMVVGLYCQQLPKETTITIQT